MYKPVYCGLSKIAVILAVGCMIGVTAIARDWFVAPTGDDFGTGTIHSPLATIQIAIARASQPGDRVIIREGLYAGPLVFRHSGNEEQPIQIFCFQDEKVIISGENVSIDEGIFISIAGVSHLHIRGIHFRKFENRVLPSIGLAVAGPSQGVQITDCSFEYFSPLDPWDGELKALAVFSTNGNEVSDIKIEGNAFNHISTGQSEVVSINGEVRNFWVIRNEITACSCNPILQCAGGYDIEFANGLRTDPFGKPSWGVFSRNHVHDNSDGYGPMAVYIDGASCILVEANLIAWNDVAIGVHTEELRAVCTQDVFICNNWLENNFFGITIGNDPGIFGWRPPGAVNRVFIFNNTLIGSLRPVEAGRSDVSELVFLNNLFDQEWGEFNDPVYFTFDSLIPVFRSDYNVFSTQDGVSPSFLIDSVVFEDFTRYRSGTGLDLSSVSERIIPDSMGRNPEVGISEVLKDAGSGNFLTGMDFYGNPRLEGRCPDVGAVESLMEGSEPKMLESDDIRWVWDGINRCLFLFSFRELKRVQLFTQDGEILVESEESRLQLPAWVSGDLRVDVLTENDSQFAFHICLP